MLHPFRPFLAAVALALPVALGAPAIFAPPARAQGTQVDFSGLKQDPNLPVNVTADQLKVDQAAGNAVFTGNVIVVQGKMRLAAPTVRVEYATTAKPAAGTAPTDATKTADAAKAAPKAKSGKISSLFASGGVTLSTEGEAAESKDAVYHVADGKVQMTGDVVLTQGPNAMSGQKLDIDLAQGTGTMQGRVQTVFQPQSGTATKTAPSSGSAPKAGAKP